MRERFPAEWEAAQRELRRIQDLGDEALIRAALRSLEEPVAVRGDRRKPQKVLIAETVRRQMIVQIVRQSWTARAAGVSEGTLKLGPVNKAIVRRLFFDERGARKAASLTVARLVWPLLSQRRRVLPMVQARGIYCFHTRALIRGLSRLINGRACLEIAAGDGTLARLLRQEGVHLHATDDHSWHGAVDYGEDVEQMSAARALTRFSPQVVLCSWPPAGNDFERHVFTTPSVETYIVITGRAEPVAGNWDAYRQQSAFEIRRDAHLSRAAFPPGINAVQVFTRRS